MMIPLLSLFRLTTPRAVILLAIGLILMISGCGGSTPCIVSGTVLVDDHPAEGVYVVFHASGQSAQEDSGTARTDADGSFSLVVSQPGESTITLFWPKVTVKEGESFEGQDLFYGIYRDPQKPVSTATIQEGETTIPTIKVKRPPPGRNARPSRR